MTVKGIPHQNTISSIQGKILIVADKKDHPKRLEHVLKKSLLKTEVLTAQAGKQGLEIACKELPDVVLLDIGLPDLDGFKICNHLKIHEATKNIPVILFTGVQTNAKNMLKALESGVDGFLRKPIDEIEMVTQVKTMLRIKKAEDKLRAEKNQLKHLVSKSRQLKNEKEKQKKTENELKRSLKEKELLLMEIHHRVKNNLAMVSSLLNIQSSYLKDEQARAAFAESRRRIGSIALVHEKLYQSTDLASIEFNHYIHDLTYTLINSYAIPPDLINIIIDIDNNIHLDIDTSIPLGLMVTELLTNSLKYGFKDDQKLTITLRLKTKGLHYYLTVADDGVGIPEDLDWQNTETLGIQLVILLTEQFEGKIQLNRGKGTSFQITFPKPKKQETYGGNKN